MSDKKTSRRRHITFDVSSIGRAELREILSAAWHYAMEHQQPAKKPRRKTSARTRTARR